MVHLTDTRKKKKKFRLFPQFFPLPGHTFPDPKSNKCSGKWPKIGQKTPKFFLWERTWGSSLRVNLGQLGSIWVTLGFFTLGKWGASLRVNLGQLGSVTRSEAPPLRRPKIGENFCLFSLVSNLESDPKIGICDPWFIWANLKISDFFLNFSHFLAICTPFPDVKGLGTRQAHATGGSGGRSPPAAGGHGSKRLLHGTGWAASFVLYCDCLRPVLMSLGSLCSRNASWSP